MLYKDRLKTIRERNGVKQIEIAKAMGLSNTRYCSYENELEIFPLKHLFFICEYLNVSLDYIFSFSDTINYKTTLKVIDRELAGKRLKEFRKDNNLTQVKLAELLNTVHPVITNYENGKHLIATPFLYTICSKYHISADYLLGKIDNPKYLK
ncbi:MAG: helix-turn-helix domain-containing protein [Ruminococcus sp.]|nr:helix-turn-helix domain-containing protein [Ruminococcus sp.]